MDISICYEKSFVAYLDVLGFKNLVFNNDMPKIEKYFNVINEEIDNLSHIQGKETIGSIIISDSVILSMPQITDANKNKMQNLRQFCIAIGRIQQRLAIENIWLRGAISFGDTFFDQDTNQIVGPAYIKAFELEKQYALYPRIILDTKLINEMEFNNASNFINSINKYPSSGNISDWGEKILFNWYEGNVFTTRSIQQDVPLFIDYIFPLVEKRDNTSLVKIMNNIKDNIYKDISIYSKHRWLTNYIKEITSKHGFGSEIDLEMFSGLSEI